MEDKKLDHVTVTKGASGGHAIEHHFDDGTSETHVTSNDVNMKAHLLAHLGSRWDHKPFTTPSGKTLTPGETVKHKQTGHTGRVVGQHPGSKKAEVLWDEKPKAKK